MLVALFAIFARFLPSFLKGITCAACLGSFSTLISSQIFFHIARYEVGIPTVFRIALHEVVGETSHSLTLTVQLTISVYWPITSAMLFQLL